MLDKKKSTLGKNYGVVVLVACFLMLRIIWDERSLYMLEKALGVSGMATPGITEERFRLLAHNANISLIEGYNGRAEYMEDDKTLCANFLVYNLFHIYWGYQIVVFIDRPSHLVKGSTVWLYTSW